MALNSLIYQNSWAVHGCRTADFKKRQSDDIYEAIESRYEISFRTLVEPTAVAMGTERCSNGACSSGGLASSESSVIATYPAQRRCRLHRRDGCFRVLRLPFRCIGSLWSQRRIRTESGRGSWPADSEVRDRRNVPRWRTSALRDSLAVAELTPFRSAWTFGRRNRLPWRLLRHHSRDCLPCLACLEMGTSKGDHLGRGGAAAGAARADDVAAVAGPPSSLESDIVVAAPLEEPAADTQIEVRPSSNFFVRHWRGESPSVGRIGALPLSAMC